MSIISSPSTWRSVRIRDVVHQQLTREQRATLEIAQQVSFLPMEAIGEQGELDLSIKRDKDTVSTGYTLFFDDDVLVAKITPCFENGKGAVAKNLLNGIGFGTTELHVLRPSHEIDPQFLYYVTVSQPFRALGEADMTGAAGQKRVPTDFVYNYRIALPPLPTQRAIAAYLDRETARIDALIDAKQRLLTLLAEKRRALITHAVTRGLDPDVPMHDSGVPWLGKVPAHWEVPPVFAKYEVMLGKMLDEKKILGANLAPYLRNVDVQWHRINTIDLPQMDFDGEDKITYSLRKGDILICEGGEIGRTAIWEGELDECYFQKALHRLRPITPFEDPYFFESVMEAAIGIGFFAAEGNRSTIQHLTAEKLRVFRFPSPPQAEQNRIVNHIRAEGLKTDTLYLDTRRTIDLLQERRAALIASAVTGQIYIEE